MAAARIGSRSIRNLAAADATLTLELDLTPRFRLASLPGEALPESSVTSTYFDSDDHRLARAGVILRRRVEARRGAWHLKLPGGASRIVLPGGPGAPPAELNELVTAFLRGAELRQVAVLRTRHSGVRLTGNDGSVADVTVDAVARLEGGHVTDSFRELDAVVTGGTARSLRRLERMLERAGAIEGDGRQKLYRALHLPVPEPLPVPTRDATLREHLHTMLATQLAAILAHDPGTRHGVDPEELHQLRVATRRLRAFLRAARPLLELEWAESLRAELGWVGGVLGPVRDLDVLLERLHDDARTLDPADQRPLQRLYGLLEAEREVDRDLMLEAMRSDRYLTLLDRLEAAVAKPRLTTEVGSVAEIAAAEFRRFRKAAKALGDPPADEELHALRIRGKRARYSAELAEPVAGKGATRFIQAAKQLQDVLGEHQDSVVAEARIRGALRQLGGKGVSFAAGRLVERERGRRAAAREAYPDALEALLRAGKAAWS